MKKHKLISKTIFIIICILFIVGLLQVKSISTSIEHTHIWATKYDSTNHWEYCTVCNETRNTTAHIYTENWQYGRKNCNDSCIKTCDCGYSYTYRIPHTDSGRVSCYATGVYHYTWCTVCGNWLSSATCKKADGSKITCNNLGTCATCQHEYTSTSIKHIINSAHSGNKKCSLCNKELLNSMTLKSLEYSEDRRTITVIVNTVTKSPVKTISNIQYANATSGTSCTSKTATINDDGSYDVKYVISINNEIHTTYSFNVRYDLETDDDSIRMESFNVTLKPDNLPPVINDVLQTPQETSNGWTTISQLEITGTETYSDLVYITIKDKETGKIYVNNATVNVEDEEYSYICTPPLEGGENGRTYVVSVKDRTSNIGNKEFIVSQMDGSEPSLDSETAYTNWTKEKKTVTLQFSDYGSGGIQLSYGDQSHYQALTMNNGVARWTKEYSTEQTGTSKYDIYVRDALGNAGKYTIEVGNIDYTKPIVSKVEATAGNNNATVKVTATDTGGSGVKTYYLKKGSEAAVSNTTGTFTVTSPGTYTGYVVDNAGNQSESKTVTATCNYTLTVNPNGGTWDNKTGNSTFTIVNGGTKEIEGVPTRTGYTFGGWTVSGTGSQLTGTTFTMGTANSTLTAKWNANIYKVTLNGKGATSTNHTTAVYEKYNTGVYLESGCTNAMNSGSKITIPEKEYTVKYNYNGGTGDVPTATAKYTFGGYYTGENGSGDQMILDTGAINASKFTNTKYTDNNGILYAKWTATSVGVNTPSRTGYTFRGWYSNEGCTGNAVIEVGETYKPEGNIDVYAKWTANTYTVTYNGNNSTSGSMTASSHTYDTASNLTANAFKREYVVTYEGNGGTPEKANDTAKYEFANWNTKADGTGITYNNSGSVSTLTSEAGGNVNLYAQWTKKGVVLPSATRTGYTFAGWYTKATNGEKKGVAGDTYIPEGTTILYAGWTVNKYGYTVNYYEEGTTTALATAKTGAQTNYGTSVIESAIEIAGYVKPTGSQTITIGVEGNVINFYYTKRTDLEYTVKYLEKETNKVLATEKTVGNKTYKERVTERAIDIDGYVTPTGVEGTKAITIEVSGNEIIFYYCKRTDLSYTVNYLEKTTNRVIRAAKIIEGQTFEAEIKAVEEVEEIDGWNHDSDSVEKIKIGTDASRNVINIYYTKVTGLSYTINYLEEGTNEVVYPAKKVGEQTFETVVNAEEHIAQVEGYNYAGEDKESITIGTNEANNVINIYYTKRTDLSYHVKYLEEGVSGETAVLSAPKTVDGQTFKAVVTETPIDIEGFEAPEAQEKTIEVEGNEIIFYYVRRTDLTYTVRYLEKVTTEEGIEEDVEIAPVKNVPGQTYESEKEEEAIEVAGYVTPTGEEGRKTVKIGVGENVINFYYTRRTDLEYHVKYLKKVENEEVGEIEIAEEKVVGNQTYKEEIESLSERVDIRGYKFDKVERERITIGVSGNVIKLYYLVDDEQRKDLSYTVEYYKDNIRVEEDTDERSVNVQWLEPNIVEVDKNKINTVDKYIAYDLEKTEPEEIPDVISAGSVIKVYYRYNERKTGYKIEYYYDNEIDDSRTELNESGKNEVITRDKIEDKVEENKVEGYEVYTVLNVPLTADEPLDSIDKNVIKVHYKKENPDEPEKVAYSIEYYYDNKKANEKTEIEEVEIGTVITEEMIDTGANLTEGYRLLYVANTPLTTSRDIENNVIKVYYEKEVIPVPVPPVVEEKVEYRVEYYYDGEIDGDKTERVEVEKGRTITREEVDTAKNIIEGYELSDVANTPLITTENIGNNVIKVFYVKVEEEPEPDEPEKYAYRIEYYYEGVKDNDRTESLVAQEGTEITEIRGKVEENTKAGYTYEKAEGLPLTITSNVEGNVIKVYYTKDTEEPIMAEYRIEYYYDGEIDEEKTERVEVEVGTKVNKAEIEEKARLKLKEGYRIDSLTNATLVVGEKEENNVIKVKYVKEEIPEPEPEKTAYKIEYYYGGEIDNTKTEMVMGIEVGTEIVKAEIEEKAEAKEKEGYKLLKISNTPLKVGKEIANNVIKVFYSKVEIPVEEKVEYRIEYYYDGNIDEDRTERIEVEKGIRITREEINTKVEANKKEGYNLLDVLNAPLIVGANVGNNVIKVMYEKEPEVIIPDEPKTYGYRIEYYYEGVKDNDRTESLVAQEGTEITEVNAKVEENTKAGYTYDRVEGLPLIISSNIEGNVIRVYYTKDASLPVEPIMAEYRIEYYYDDEIEEEKTERATVEVGTEIAKEEIEIKARENLKEGYRVGSLVNATLVVGEKLENNVIKVKYVREDESVIEEKTAYSIEYYYDGEIDNTRTDIEEVKVGYEITKEMVGEKVEANIKEGYKLIQIANTPLITSNNVDNNIIKVFYIKEIPEEPDILAYSIEYYYDRVLDNTKTKVITAEKGTEIRKEDIPEEIEAGERDRYELSIVVNTPLIVGENIDNNVIKIYFRSIPTEIPGPDEPERVAYRIEYYYAGEKDNERTDIEEVLEGTEITKETVEEKAEANVKEGYELLTIKNSPLKVSKDLDNNVIKIYYREIPEEPPAPPVEEKVEYIVEYYYDGEVDTSKTERYEIEAGRTITREEINTKIEANKKEGYNLLDVLNAPLIVKAEGSNVIKVFYTKIPEPGPEPVIMGEYIIEYYYEEEIDKSKSEAQEVEVGTIITEEDMTSKITENTRAGYEYDRVENIPLEVAENRNETIKIYYRRTEEPLAKAEYRIEYYYDEVIDEEKTERERVEVGTKINKGEIEEKAEANVKEGYRIESLVNATLVVGEKEENNVIKVKYVKEEPEEEKTAYSIEYYYDNEIDNSKSEVEEVEVGTVIKGEMIDKEKNLKEGYKFLFIVNTPLTTSKDIENNVIKVYYEKEVIPVPVPPVVEEKVEYRIEYYYDGEIDTSITDRYEIEKGRIITREEVDTAKNIIEGYELSDVANVPLTTTENIGNNVIKVFYVREEEPDPDEPEKYAYRIEYYYEGVKDNDRTESLVAQEGTEITEIRGKVEENAKARYTYEKVEGLPLTITSNVEGNVIKVYYAKDAEEPEEPTMAEYRIEYYYDGEIDEEKTERVEVEVGTKVNKAEIEEKARLKLKEGYRLDSLTNATLVVGEKEENNVIKVNYVKEEIPEPEPEKTAYKVEYYYGGEIDNTKTEIVMGIEVGTEIVEAEIEEKVEANEKEGYKLLQIANTPLNISKEIEKNVIKIYYVKEKVENPENPAEEIDNEIVGYTVEYYIDNEKDNSCTEVIGVEVGTVVTSEMIKEHIGEDLGREVSREARREVLRRIEIEEGAKLIGVLNTPLKVTEKQENNIIKVHYTMKDLEELGEVPYQMEYYYNGEKDNRITELVIGERGSIIETEDVNAKVEEYKPENAIEVEVVNTPLELEVLNVDVNRVQIYYVEEVAEEEKVEYTIEYYYDEEKDEEKTEVLRGIVGSVVTKRKLRERIEDNIKGGYEFTEVNAPLVVSKERENIVRICYGRKTDLSYIVEYYYDGEKDETKTVVVENQRYEDVIEECEDKVIRGYKLERTENLPLTIKEFNALNVIEVYYEKENYEYTINYYYDGEKDETKIISDVAPYGTLILPDGKEKPGYKLERFDPIKLIISDEADKNVMNVYYELREGKIVVKYVNEVTGEEIKEAEERTGKVYENYDITDLKAEIEGYTLVEEPEEIGRYTEEEQEKVYKYAKNTQVEVKYVDKTSGEKLAEETIEGYEGKAYETRAKEIENYELVEETNNTKGRMGADTIEVTYTYLRKAKVIVKHIDQNTERVIETEEEDKLYGETYRVEGKDISQYVLVSKEKEEVTIAEDEIIVKCYYKKVSEGLIVKHINIITEEIIETEVFEGGKEGDTYETEAKEIEGFKLKYEENTRGELEEGVTEAKYYYIREARVRIERVDVKEGTLIGEAEYINGEENEEYSTRAVEIEGYSLIETPANAKGTMKVRVNEDGTVNVETVVRYGYAKESGGVIVKYLDAITKEAIEKATKYTGNEGDEYKVEAKELEGYDLVEGPESSEGTMTAEEIVIEYYYARRVKVVVEYIDKNTEEEIEDSTEEIEGHEGQGYRTEAKEFEGYVLVERPENAEGPLEAKEKEDGTVITTIKVKYYYVHESKGVVVKYVDLIRRTELGEDKISGNEGDTYKVEAKAFEGYDVEEGYTDGEAEGRMRREEIEVKYYYRRKTKVIVKHVEEDGTKIEEEIIEGHEKDKYITKSKEIEGYELIEEPENAKGEMTREEIVVIYEYKKIGGREEEPKEPTNPDEEKPGEKEENKGGNSSSDNSDNSSNNNNSNNNENSDNGSSNNGNSNNGNGTTNIVNDINNNSSTSTKPDSNSNSNNNNNNGTSTTNNNNKSNTTSATTSSSESGTMPVKTPGTGDMLPIIAIGTILVIVVANGIVIVIRRKRKAEEK